MSAAISHDPKACLGPGDLCMATAAPPFLIGWCPGFMATGLVTWQSEENERDEDGTTSRLTLVGVLFVFI